MKKILAIIIALLLPGCAVAETAAPAQPSREWLGAYSADILSAMQTICADSAYIDSLGLPDSVRSLLAPAAAYESQPSVVIYAPTDESAIAAITTMAGTSELPKSITANVDRLFGVMLTGMLYQYCTTEQLALSNSITLNEYLHCQSTLTPATAFWAPADGAAGDAIMLQCRQNSGIVTLTANLMPAFILSELQNPESTISTGLSSIGAEIVRSGDASRAFTPDMSIPVDTPAADEAWLTETALETAAKMVEQVADPEYVRLFTTSEELMDICANIGSIDLSCATVSSIVYHDTAQLMLAFGLDSGSTVSPVVEKYISPGIASIYLQSKINAYGVNMAAASSVCAYGDLRVAAGDFAACTVMLECGDAFDIGVTFGMTGNNVAVINARPVPSE